MIFSKRHPFMDGDKIYDFNSIKHVRSPKKDSEGRIRDISSFFYKIVFCFVNVSRTSYTGPIGVNVLLYNLNDFTLKLRFLT